METFHNEGPLRERDGAIINNWYIICTSSEVKKRPIAQVIYDQQYVIFRNDCNRPVVLKDRCLHRHALLSMGGNVEQGKIQCPYHGWTYNDQGQVVHIPSEGPTNTVSRKLCLKSLPSFEREGVIWVWMGESTPNTKSPPWHFPNFNKKGWEHYFMITDFDNEVVHLAENFMDVPHTVFVHRGWFRNPKAKKIPTTIETQNGQVLVTYLQKQDELSLIARWVFNPRGRDMTHTDCYIFPNITCVEYWFGHNGYIINSQITPISTLKSRVYTYISYKINPLFKRIIRPFVHYYTRQVINQDVDIMLNQGKSLGMDSRCNFRSTPADEVHISIERLRHFGIRGDERATSFNNCKKVEFWV